MTREPIALDSLRPRGFFDLLDGVFRLYRSRWTAISSILFLFLGLPAWYIQFALMQTGSADPAAPVPVGWLDLLLLLAAGLVALLMAAVLTPLTAAGVTAAAAEGIRGGKKLSPWDILSAVRRSGVTVVLTLLLKGVLMAAVLFLPGMLLFVPAGLFALAADHWEIPILLAAVIYLPLAAGGLVFLYVRLFLTIPVVTEEGIGYIRAFRRSWLLTGGAFWRTAGLACLVLVIGQLFSTVPVLLLEIAFAPDPASFPGVTAGWRSVLLALPAAFFSCLPLALQPILAALLYHDRRARKEGADLERDLDALSETAT